MILSLGAPLPQARKDQLNALLPGRFHELYGLTEGFVTILDKTDAVRKSGSVGCPPPFSAVRIVDEAGRDLPPGQPARSSAAAPSSCRATGASRNSPRRPCATAGSSAATSATSTPRAISTSSTARRT
jgi:acyl-coenzyme A synthetase/AMP-(fatty) acid ligase